MADTDFDLDGFSLAILQASPDCIRLLDLDGRVLFMNDAGKRLLEITDFSKSRGLYWPDVSNTQNREEAIAAIAAAARGENHNFRSYFPTAQGTPKWWDTLVAPVFAPDGRTIVRLMAMSRDVTAEVEMRSFLDTIIQVVPAGLFVKDARDGRFLVINAQAAAVFGFAAGDMIGKTDHDFFPAGQADFFRHSDLEVIASRELLVIDEEAVTNAAGEVRYLRTKKIGTYGDEGPRHLVGLFEDITEQRATRLALDGAIEQAQAANQAKADFLTNMSHELRTPLNGVVALVDMLSRSTVDAQQGEMIRLIQSSAAALTLLVSDILEVGRVERGEKAVKLAEFDIADLFTDAIDRAAPQARAKDLDLRIDWEALPCRAIGDQAGLAQILDHLLSNALKFTSHGEVVVRVASTPLGGGPLRFVVRDTGIGFSDEQQDRLFARFEQVDGSSTRPFGGSGLGLAVCHGLVERMGGTVTAAGVPGVGAEFTVEAPLKANISAAMEHAAQAREAGAPLRVLLAEDHPTNRKIVELILQSVGADLTSVENGQLAVDECRTGDFDVILMDMQMPVMDGLTATRLIREEERRCGRVRTPVICVTANALPQHVEASRLADMDLHLAKPITAEKLLDAIDAVLDSTQESGLAGTEEASAALH